MPTISVTTGSSLASINYSIYDTQANQSVASGVISASSPSIDLTSAQTPNVDYRIYFYNGSLDLSGAPPDGTSTTTTPFSFVEYNINDTGQISLDVSYINDWAYPIQVNAGSQTYGFKSANGVVSMMLDRHYADFLPSSASASGYGPVGQTKDLYDIVNKRFVGPLSIFANQAKWADWTYSLQWVESGWAGTSAAPWLQFSSDVPGIAMPYGGAGATEPGVGFVPSGNASITSAQFPASDQLPTAPGTWPLWINGPSGYYSNYPNPQYGFDFSTSYPFNPANVNDGSGESQTLPTNFAVWNNGYSRYEPGIPANNVSPDHYSVNGTSYSNGYTAALRAQALKDGGEHAVDGKPKHGFFTFPLDNFNGEFNNYELDAISLTIWPLATVNVVGTAGNDELYGTDGDDVIIGGGGGDWISGSSGGGGDPLANGGRDTYLYFQSSESQAKRRNRDTIVDFRGEDLIDLSEFDADADQAGIQSFAWIGGSRFSRAPGELRFKVQGSGILLQGNTDRDRSPEFEIRLLGLNAIGQSQLLL